MRWIKANGLRVYAGAVTGIALGWIAHHLYWIYVLDWRWCK